MDPSPKMIFVIGWHKTATTSISHALSLLGYPCWHFPFELYPSIASGQPDFDLLRPWKAAADLPIPLISRELQRRFPEAYFLMTVRDEEAWLGSVERMFRIGNQPRPELGGRSFWDAESGRRFTHQIHELAYGATRFDRDRFLTRYRRHNDQVRRQFAGWEGAYLELDATDGLAWGPLCRWLGCREPKEPFPRLNVQSSTEWVVDGIIVDPTS